MNRAASWGAGAALVALAWGAAALTPSDDAVQEPFPVTASIGERAAGRNIAAQIADVRRADSVAADGWSAEGNWVVVDLDTEALVAEFGALLSVATLEVDGRTFSASERPDSLYRTSLSAGIPKTGSLAFELAPDIDDAPAVLTLAAAPLGDTRLDSIITLEIDLGALETEDEITLVETGWSSP